MKRSTFATICADANERGLILTYVPADDMLDGSIEVRRVTGEDTGWSIQVGDTYCSAEWYDEAEEAMYHRPMRRCALQAWQDVVRGMAGA